MIPSGVLSIMALLLTLIVHGSTSVSAQGNPPGTAEMAFASIQDQTLYVQGGYSNTFTDQFYALNLTKDSWSPLSPPWSSLSNPLIFIPTNVRVTISNGMTVTKDQKRLVIWAETGVFWFNLETSSWDHRAANGLAGEGILLYSYRRAATDGETGLVYIPSAAQGGSKMVVLNPDTLDAHTVDMPPASLISAVIQLYGWVWSDLRKSFIFTGGEYNSLNNDKTLEYFPGNNTWTQLTTLGAKIPAISRHCMVSGYSGRKMVLYGGQEFSGGKANLRGAIFVLDVPTLTWTQGPNVPTDYISADMACTISGTNFISWGGECKTVR
ncbi:hypothetical protein BGZ95_002379 [Linnemannia exigua]|uniref:Kelch repeat-containing protein n=1 Tax=Linnemannia exigua TaxID=604196 RepID=A0AAD4DII4_9FUNG|nr:hypothetical protein BGZ95_002379 [Linnemannia exigua]